jgi:uncharacterized protein (DUF1501 family)
MDRENAPRINRRGFLKVGGALGSALVVNPFALLRGSGRPDNSARILVWVELLGGNDGLNTVVPRDDVLYRKHRPVIGLSRNALLRIDDRTGLHPSLAGFRSLLDGGNLAIVRSVGPPKPDRSHFRSMAIWRKASMSPETCLDGWMGRALCRRTFENALLPAVTAGDVEMMPAFAGAPTPPAAIGDLDGFSLKVPRGSDADRVKAMIADLCRAEAPAPPDSSLSAFVKDLLLSSLRTADVLEATSRRYRPSIPYPASPLGKRLLLAAKLIEARLGTRLITVSTTGFDTHAQQERTHALLLKDAGDSLHAFFEDQKAKGRAEQVLVVVTSEFGRRVSENGSRGTDHGAGGPAFLISGRVRPGLFGTCPDLSDLLEGDVRPETDFRSLIATALSSWLGLDPAGILEGSFEPLDAVLA